MLPKMKSEIRAGDFNLEHYWINFNSTPEAATAMQQFGQIDKHLDTERSYTLWVDRRYDLMEVYAYIQGYGKEAK